MALFSQPLHDDVNEVKTSARYGDPGDGVSDWFIVAQIPDGANPGQGATTDAAVANAGNGSLVALLKGLQQTTGQTNSAVAPTGDGTVIGLLKSIRDGSWRGRPSTSTPLATSSGVVSNAAAVAALAASSGLTNYCTGFSLTYGGASSAGLVIATLAGGPATLSYVISVPGTVTDGKSLTITFDTPYQASAANTAITLTMPALGAGNTHAVANIHGFRV